MLNILKTMFENVSERQLCANVNKALQKCSWSVVLDEELTYILQNRNKETIKQFDNVVDLLEFVTKRFKELKERQQHCKHVESLLDSCYRVTIDLDMIYTISNFNKVVARFDSFEKLLDYVD